MSWSQSRSRPSLRSAFCEPQFLGTFRSFSRFWLFYFKLDPLPCPTLTATGRGRAGAAGSSADPGSAPSGALRPWRPRPDPGGDRGRAASAPFSALGQGPRAGIRAGLSRELTSKRATGAGHGVRRGGVGKPGPRPSAAPTCGPGGAEAERAAGDAAGCNRTVRAIGSAAPSPPRGSERGIPPRPDPAPGRPCPRGAEPAPGPGLQGGGPDPAPNSLLAWSPPQHPPPAQPNLALPTFLGDEDPASVPSLLLLLSFLPPPPAASERDCCIQSQARGT